MYQPVLVRLLGMCVCVCVRCGLRLKNGKLMNGFNHRRQPDFRLGRNHSTMTVSYPNKQPHGDARYLWDGLQCTRRLHTAGSALT